MIQIPDKAGSSKELGFLNPKSPPLPHLFWLWLSLDNWAELDLRMTKYIYANPGFRVARLPRIRCF